MHFLRWYFPLVGALLLGQTVPARAPAPKEDKNKAFVEEVLKEVQVPELLFCPKNQMVFKNEALPAFDAKILSVYPASSAQESKLRPAVMRARALLWALSGQAPPADLAEAVKHLRSEIKIDLSAFPERYAVPANENQFRTKLLASSRDLAGVLQQLSDGLEELQLNSKERDAEPPRWRANYDFIEANLMLRIAQVYEYQSMVGMMRKELPPYDPKAHTGWQLKPIERVQGDAVGKRMAAEAHKILEGIVKQHAGTPWEVLGKRLKNAPAGLEWQAVK